MENVNKEWMNPLPDKGMDYDPVLAVVIVGDEVELEIPLLDFTNGTELKLCKVKAEITAIMQNDSVVKYRNPITGNVELNNIPNKQLFNNR